MLAGRTLCGSEQDRLGPEAAYPENSFPGLFRRQTGGFCGLDGRDARRCSVSAVLQLPSAARGGEDLLGC